MSGIMMLLAGLPTITRSTASYTYSANTTDASLNITSLFGYVAGSTDVTITVNSGVYVYATSTTNAGLTLTGGTIGDTVTLINNGFILGKGGDGNIGPNSGANGGPALSLGFNTTINNTNPAAYIAGGGGGGSGGTTNSYGGGGGAGGGKGGDGAGGAVGGTGGGPGLAGADGTGTAGYFGYGGGAGGGGG